MYKQMNHPSHGSLLLSLPYDLIHVMVSFLPTNRDVNQLIHCSRAMIKGYKRWCVNGSNTFPGYPEFISWHVLQQQFNDDTYFEHSPHQQSTEKEQCTRWIRKITFKRKGDNIFLVLPFFPKWITHLHIQALDKSTRFPIPIEMKMDYRTLVSLRNLTHLSFSGHFKSPIDLESFALPSSLISLTFGSDFNQPIDSLHLPESLTHLDLGFSFNQPLHNFKFPPSLRSLVVGHVVHKRDGHPCSPMSPISWPVSLKRLKIFQFWDSNVPWPVALKKLVFGSPFDQPVKNWTFPSTLKVLTFGYMFNQPVQDMTLPPTLTHLKFGRQFNQPIQDLKLPPTLTHLTFGDLFNQSLQTLQLPPSLKCLKLGRSFQQSLRQVQLPSSIKQFYLEAVSLPEPEELEDVQWPVSLTDLHLSTSNISLRGLKLPHGLQSLTFGMDVNQSIKDLILPSTIKRLTFGDCFNQPIVGFTLPSSLTHLTFGEDFNQPIDGVQFPSSLRHLEFGESFNQPIDGIQFPSSLKHLEFGECFNQPFDKLQLPQLLTHLICEND